MADEATGTATLHEETLRELGLGEQPFVDGKKPYRFTDSALQKNRASLEQHARFGESVHLMLGDTGVGKTILLSQLIKHCKNSIKPFVAKGSEGFVAEAFLTAVLNQLGGTQCETMTELVESLAPEFTALNEQQFTVLLAIDDAHLAPVEEIAELINVMAEFTESGNITARLLLTGEATLKSSLEAIAREYDGMTFDPSVTKVSALTEPQMRDYLSSRLNHAGHTDVFPFTEKALAKIHRESAGLPARVNTISAHYLNTVFANTAGKKAGGGLFAALGWPLVALGTAAVGLIAWGLSMFIGGDDNNNQIVEVKPPTIVANAPVEIKLVDDTLEAEAATPGESALQSASQGLAQNAAETTGLTTSPNSSDLNNAIDNLADTNLQSGQIDADTNLLQPADADADESASLVANSDLVPSPENSTTDTENNLQQLSETANTTLPSTSDTATGETATSVISGNPAVEAVSETVIAASSNLSETTDAAGQLLDDGIDTSNTGINTGNADSTEAATIPSTVQPDIDDNKTIADSEAVDITNLTDSDALAENNGVAVPILSESANADADGISSGQPIHTCEGGRKRALGVVPGTNSFHCSTRNVARAQLYS